MTTKARILVVDDEEDILELVRYNLVGEGFDVIPAETGEQALKIAGNEHPDLILLDLMLPGINGIEVAKRLKNNVRTRDIPIIMLTARGEEADIVLGLEVGADDYVTKPFSPRVLNARTRAVIRRNRSDVADPGTVIRIRDLVIDPGRRRVELRGKEIDLSFTEFQILLFLSRRPGWVFTRSQIVDAVRGENYPVTDRSVDVQIVGLRKKLGSCGNYIQTVRGVGYRFKELS
ncbi:MAG: response regulator [Desulfococcus multivorans]|jgi:two-component system phosphate regulon response regulator PhoB|nr:response regulator [Desulfococcus multivorans]